jgi:hypothetical protein
MDGRWVEEVVDEVLMSITVCDNEDGGGGEQFWGRGDSQYDIHYYNQKDEENVVGGS